MLSEANHRTDIVLMSVGFDASKEQPAAKAITLKNKEPFAWGKGLIGKWLPESDAHQNGKGLLFEFPFGQLNIAKGQKRLLPDEAFGEAARENFIWPKTRSRKDQLKLAQECQEKLRDFPALTRTMIAKQLGITTARLNQLLALLKPPRIGER